jgi:hypothetical protein
MNRRTRDLRRMSEAVAHQVGARLASLETTNGGHLRAVFVGRGGERTSVFLPSTPGDVRGDRNDAALVRRVLRERVA